MWRSPIDPSGGRNDSATLVMGHRYEAGTFVAYVVRGRASPHDPGVVTLEFAGLCYDYGVREVRGDN